MKATTMTPNLRTARIEVRILDLTRQDERLFRDVLLTFDLASGPVHSPLKVMMASDSTLILHAGAFNANLEPIEDLTDAVSEAISARTAEILELVRLAALQPA